jgi:HAD superfamily hydrolase (TIGR01509 family)
MMLRHRDIQAVIFDIDGTLVDTFSAYYTVFSKGIAGYALNPIPRADLRRYLAEGLSLRAILEKIFPESTEESTFAACREEIMRLFRELEVQEVKAFPGAEELLKALRDKGVKIGIATGRMSSVEDEWVRFKRLGLDQFIEAIVTSREVPYRKPAPDVIVECAKRLGVSLETCIVIGDTIMDVIAAKAAGAIAVVVTTGHEDEDQLLEAGADLVLHGLNELITHLSV